MEGGDEEFQVYFSTQQLKESQMNPGVWWLNESQRKIPELDGRTDSSRKVSSFGWPI